jgi:alpha-methylacyl-CoA racemase
MSCRLLEGITVLDLSRLLPGPLATWHLRRLGAEVLKIEAPGEGDYARVIGPMHGNSSIFYEHLNQGKKVVTLDLKSRGGRDAFFGYVDESDVVVESFRPTVLARLGLGFDQLRARNARVSLVSISGYGHSGMMAQAAGHDINYLALSGWLHELLPAQGMPVPPNVQIGDVFGGALMAAFAAVSRILDARRTGAGTHVDVSMTATLLSSNIMPLINARAALPPSTAGTGLLNGGVPCYGIYRTSDNRFVAVGALELKFWSKLCEVIDRADLASRHWQRGQEVGGAEAWAIRDELAKIFKSNTLSHWQEVFADVDCCVTPVLRVDEAIVGTAANRCPPGGGGASGSIDDVIRDPLTIVA